MNQEKFNEVQEQINKLTSSQKESLSDGFHSFQELYEFRKMYHAVLFNEWANQKSINPSWASEDNKYQPIYTYKYDVHKSWKHHDGELCFGGGWFIVVAILPSGQISNHYEAKEWDLFKVPIAKKAKYEFDGHTSADVIVRLKSLIIGA